MDDHELKELLSEHREKMRQEMRDEIDALFRKETETLRSQIQFYLAAAKWIGLIIAAILTAFGISKADDIEKNVTDFLKAKVDDQYSLDDPSSNLSKTMSKLISRAVVASTYIEAAASREPGPYYSPINYDRRHEINILLSVIEDKTSNHQIFTEAVAGLSYLAITEDSRVVVSHALAKVLLSEEVKTNRWAINNEDKIISIIGFPKSDIVNSAANALLSNGSDITEEITLVAIKRFRTEDYIQAAKTIAAIAASTESREIRHYAILTLATIRPTHPGLNTLIMNQLLAVDRRSSLRNLEVVHALISSRSADVPLGTPENLASGAKRIRDMGVPIMRAAIEFRLSVEYDEKTNELKMSNGYFEWLSLTPTLYRIELIDPLLKYANGISTATLIFYIESIRPRRSSVKVIAVVGKDSRIVTEKGEELSLENIKQGEVEILHQQLEDPEEDLPASSILPSVKNYLELSWTDLKGGAIKCKGVLVNPDKFRVDFP